MGKIGRNVKKCQKYLNEKKRIKNKTKNLEQRLEGMSKDEAKEHVIQVCRIGRKKEGFQREEFKFKPRKRVASD